MAFTRIVELTPTITAGLYGANDVVGGRLAFSVGQESGIVRSVIVVDASAQNAALTLFLFQPTPSSIADNAAFAPTAADNLLQLGFVSTGTYNTLTDSAYIADADIHFALSAGALYGYLVTTGTPTYTATNNLTIRLVIESDYR